MSKRRRRNKKTSPNLPQETLDRARRQLAGEDAGAETSDADSEDHDGEATSSSVTRRKRRSERRSARRKSSAPEMQPFSQRDKRKKDVLDAETIQEMLANPDKFVSEEELHEEYGYVLSDLRSMGLLAVALMVLLVVLAQFI